MNKKISWDDGFDATSSQGNERDLRIWCVFDQSSEIPESDKVVVAKLKEFASGKSHVSIHLLCGDWDSFNGMENSSSGDVVDENKRMQNIATGNNVNKISGKEDNTGQFGLSYRSNSTDDLRVDC